MTKGPHENVFSKAIDELNSKKEQFLLDEARALDKAAKEKAAKEAEENSLYNKWLNKSEEIFVQDCLEAIGEITGGEFATKLAGSISFTSEAFMFFIERLSPNPLVRPTTPRELSQVERRNLIPYHNRWKLDTQASSHAYKDVQKEMQSKLNALGKKTWSDKNVRRIFNRTRNKLKTEKFDLTTKDGIEFILHWNSTK